MANRRGQEIKKEMSAAELKDLQAPVWGTREDFVDQPLWSEILPGLWQGGTDDWDVMGYHCLPKYEKIARISKRDFDTVITLYAAAKPVDWHVRELRFGMWDSNLSDIELDDLFDIVQMAHTDWLRGKKVLVRCQAGWNRSGLVTALVLIREGYSAAEAIRLIRSKRNPAALCNPDFVEWLCGVNPEDWQGDFYCEPVVWSTATQD
jgi:protein-tyrosine phosphatase